MSKIIIFLSLIFTTNITAKEILVNITGIAKVGKECFLNLAFLNESTLSIENINLLIYSFDKNNLLLGQSEVSLQKINNKQPYETFTNVEMNSIKLCKKIKKIDVVVNNCFSKNEQVIKNCHSFFKVDNNKSIISSLEVTLSENRNYYLKSTSKNFFIPELDVSLKVLDLETAVL